MAGKSKGIKVSAFVGKTDKAIIAGLAQVRGITESQLIQEWIADDIKYTVSTGLIEKLKKVDTLGIDGGEDEPD